MEAGRVEREEWREGEGWREKERERKAGRGRGRRRRREGGREEGIQAAPVGCADGAELGEAAWPQRDRSVTTA